MVFAATMAAMGFFWLCLDVGKAARTSAEARLQEAKNAPTSPGAQKDRSDG